MNIPFSTEQFLTVFENYNRALWPVQPVLYALALLAIYFIIRGRVGSSRLVFSMLTFFWMWMGFVYHLVYFSPINQAAYLFGVVFILQGFIFLYVGVIKQKVHFKLTIDFPGVVGIIVIAYALIFYPLLGYGLGHVYPRSPTFGVPCPTTIFTFGVLLFSVGRIPWYVIIIPFLWSVVGFMAAVNLSIREDFGLVIAGALATVILFFLKPRSP